MSKPAESRRPRAGEGADARRHAAPARAFQEWCARPWHWHLGGLAALAALAFLRWHHDLTVGGPRVDEEYYLNAFEQVRRGASPYREGVYFYPPAFAFLGAWLLGFLPPMGIVYLFRAANLIGLCWTLWVALAVVPLALAWRLAAGAALLWLAQGVALGVSSGNISFAVIGAGLAGLLWWPRRPFVTGALLGLGVAVKPLFPAAILALGAHRPREQDPQRGRRRLFAAGLASLLAVALVAGFPYLGDMLEQATSEGKSSRAFSLQRMLASFGLELDPALVAAAVALATVLWVRRRRLTPFRLLCVGLSASVLATPLLWSHSMLMTLPILALALALAFRRWAAARADGRGRFRLYELAAVAALAGSVLACDGIDGVYAQPAFVQGLVIALPTLAPAALTAYALRFAEPF